MLVTASDTACASDTTLPTKIAGCALEQSQQLRRCSRADKQLYISDSMCLCLQVNAGTLCAHALVYCSWDPPVMFAGLACAAVAQVARPRAGSRDKITFIVGHQADTLLLLLGPTYTRQGPGREPPRCCSLHTAQQLPLYLTQICAGACLIVCSCQQHNHSTCRPIVLQCWPCQPLAPVAQCQGRCKVNAS